MLRMMPHLPQDEVVKKGQAGQSCSHHEQIGHEQNAKNCSNDINARAGIDAVAKGDLNGFEGLDHLFVLPG